MKDDLLMSIRESQYSSKVLGKFNATFLTLIPKNQKAESLENFRPILCCNVIYKVIAKILVRQLQPLLNSIISEG
jgi:hypothetical protein